MYPSPIKRVRASSIKINLVKEREPPAFGLLRAAPGKGGRPAAPYARDVHIRTAPSLLRRSNGILRLAGCVPAAPTSLIEIIEVRNHPWAPGHAATATATAKAHARITRARMVTHGVNTFACQSIARPPFRIHAALYGMHTSGQDAVSRHAFQLCTDGHLGHTSSSSS